MKHLTTLFFVLLFPLLMQAQEIIEWKNPSFEDTPHAARVPADWRNLFSGDSYTPVDIQPGFYGCKKIAVHGYTYLSMVIREDSSFEAIYQHFDTPLIKDSLYCFSVWLARSSVYKSSTPKSVRVPVDFREPATFALLGIDENLEIIEVLTQTSLVTDSVWHKYDLIFHPQKRNYETVAIAIQLEPGEDYPENGHILVDNLTPVIHLPANITHSGEINFSQKRSEIWFQQTKEIEIEGGDFEGCDNPENFKWTLYNVNSENLKRITNNDQVYDLYRHYLVLKSTKKGSRCAVSHHLPIEIEKNNAYEVSIWVGAKIPHKRQVIGEPLKLLIWGGTDTNPRQEILAESQVIDHPEFREYTFLLEPQKQNWNSILFEVDYRSVTETKYNGSLTFFKCSNITKIDN